MNNKKLAISILALLLITNNSISIAATKQENKKEEKAPKIITTSESFYNKIWQKYKIGSSKDKEDVVKILKKVIKERPDEFLAYYYLGIISKEEKQSNQALSYFETALTGFPKSADIHIRIAEILDEKKQKEKSNDHYIIALSLDPQEPKALSRVGIIELEKNNYNKAEEYLTKAKELEPDNSNTLRALGKTLYHLEKYSQAAEILEQTLLFDSEDANTHLLLGKVYDKLNHSEKATDHIQSASKYGKKDPELLEAIGYNIARNLVKAERYEEAISAYKKEIKKNANPALGFYEIGEVFELIGDEKSALKAYQKSYELDKKMAKGIYRCAEIYNKRNDKNNLEAMLKILKSNHEYRSRAYEMIDNIKNEEKYQAEQELLNVINGSDSKDADIETAYIEKYSEDKNDSETLEKLYNYYKERGYYDEALSWYKKYAKATSITDYEKKSVENDLKSKLEQDNYSLFGSKKEDKLSKSKVSSDDLMNLAFNADNDRQKELALQILLSRKDYKEDKRIIEEITKFYEDRGRYKEANKYINQLKKYGYVSESELKSRKSKQK